MAMLWSILGPRTNLIDRKCSIFNGEKDNVFDLWSKTHFWLIFDPFLENNGKNRVKQQYVQYSYKYSTIQ